MPKVRPLTESGKIAARWQAQDSAFYDQFEKIRRLSGLTKEKMAQHLEISVPTLLKYSKCPDEMPKKVERKLVLMAEKVGVEYDAALGGGKKKTASFNMGGMLMMIDPETGYIKACST